MKATGDPNVLYAIPLFRNMAWDGIQRLAAAASMRTARAGTILFDEGDTVDSFAVLIEGAAELFSGNDERHFTHSVVHATRPLMASSLLTDTFHLSALALEPCQLVVIPARLVNELTPLDPALARAMMRELANESLQVIDHFKNHRLLNATARLARWVLRRDNQTGETGHIDLPFDRRVLASYLGMSGNQLSRSLTELAASGLVVNGRSFTITDRRALTSAVRSSAWYS